MAKKDSVLPVVDFVEADSVVSRFRSRYDGLQDSVSADCAFVNDDDDVRVKQAFKDDSDINRIVNRYLRTGVLGDESRLALAQFGDFTRVPTYEECQNKIVAMNEAFDALPSKIRERFRNNPSELVKFLGDEDNRPEAVKLGLIDPSTGKVPVPGAPGGRTEEPKAPSTPNPEPKGSG